MKTTISESKLNSIINESIKSTLKEYFKPSPINKRQQVKQWDTVKYYDAELAFEKLQENFYELSQQYNAMGDMKEDILFRHTAAALKEFAFVLRECYRRKEEPMDDTTTSDTDTIDNN